jgi:hypothetical protein
VVVGGTTGARPAVEQGLKSRPVEGTATRVASPAAIGVMGESASVAMRFGDVRKRYLAADVEGCLSLLGGPDRVDQLLEARDRASAARLLFWRVACHVAGDQRSDAASDAAVFAALELKMPPDARDASPEVENVIDQAVQRASNEPLTELLVSASGPRAVIRLDGGDDTCVAPCVLKARRGAHVLTVTGDGVLPVTRRVELDATSRKSLAITFTSAPPAVAATQWRRRYEGTADEQSAESARLLSIAVPARYLVLLSPEQDAARTRLRGLLWFEGNVRARSEQVEARADEAAPKVVRELLYRSKLAESPSILKSPWFWAAVVGVAATASAVTYFLLTPPSEKTEVRVR